MPLLLRTTGAGLCWMWKHRLAALRPFAALQSLACQWDRRLSIVFAACFAQKKARRQTQQPGKLPFVWRLGDASRLTERKILSWLFAGWLSSFWRQLVFLLGEACTCVKICMIWRVSRLTERTILSWLYWLVFERLATVGVLAW